MSVYMHLVQPSPVIFGCVLSTAYRTDECKPLVLKVVSQAEKIMAEDKTLNHEYLPVAGLPAFREACCRLILGKENKAIADGRVSRRLTRRQGVGA